MTDIPEGMEEALKRLEEACRTESPDGPIAGLLRGAERLDWLTRDDEE